MDACLIDAQTHTSNTVDPLPSTHPQAAPIATTLSQYLPQSYFARRAGRPRVFSCLLVNRQAVGELLWGVIVETEPYS